MAVRPPIEDGREGSAGPGSPAGPPRKEKGNALDACSRAPPSLGSKTLRCDGGGRAEPLASGGGRPEPNHYASAQACQGHTMGGTPAGPSGPRLPLLQPTTTTQQRIHAWHPMPGPATAGITGDATGGFVTTRPGRRREERAVGDRPRRVTEMTRLDAARVTPLLGCRPSGGLRFWPRWRSHPPILMDMD